MILKPIIKRTWAEIDLDAARNNYLSLRGNVCCVVKADAYGHGSVQLSKLYEELGCTYFAVSNTEEAIQLRQNGIKANILILGYTPPECALELSKYNIEQAVYNYDYALSLHKYCLSNNITLKIHIKIDTGMGRLGFQYHSGINELPLALSSCSLSSFIVKGIFTHFSSSDEYGDDSTNNQYSYFKKAISYFDKNGIHFAVKHCSNSAASIFYPQFSLDMIRAGIILYGICPSKDMNSVFKPVLSLYSVVSNVKRIPKGASVSYGRKYIADKETLVATVSIGYADGFWRSNEGGFVYLNGKYCKIIGRVCMDQIMVECESANIGDIVEIYGEHISILDVAEYNNTIPYEILCSIGPRVPRVYYRNGQIVDVLDRVEVGLRS